MTRNENRDRVLIVDDVPANIKVLGEAIRDDYEILVATNGEKAIELATSERKPDLILLDIIMPDIDGYEVCRRLKEDPGTADIPIIFITSKSEVDDEAKGFEAGVVDYIIKPFSLPIVRARVKTHLALKRQRDELQALNETKNRFLGTAAHDLRNPLAAIRGLAEIILEEAMGPISEEQREMLRMMYSTSDHMLSLVNDLLDVAVIESGKFDLKLEKGDFIEALDERIRILRPTAQKKRIDTVTQFAGLEPFYFDRERIVQVFDNLYSNAVKFSNPGTRVEVRLTLEDTWVRLEVRDEGPGIKEADQKNMFGEFQKFGTKTTGGESSTGLGLSIVNRIMKAHDGAVEVDSREGIGTTMIAKRPFRRNLSER